MNKQPTPETDQFKIKLKTTCGEKHWVPLEHSERLERERDEAREAAAKWESSFDAMERAGAEQARRADENREWALRAERERDEAREALLKIEEVFVDGCDTYDDWKAMGDIARAAVEKFVDPSCSSL